MTFPVLPFYSPLLHSDSFIQFSSHVPTQVKREYLSLSIQEGIINFDRPSDWRLAFRVGTLAVRERRIWLHKGHLFKWAKCNILIHHSREENKDWMLLHSYTTNILMRKGAKHLKQTPQENNNYSRVKPWHANSLLKGTVHP